MLTKAMKKYVMSNKAGYNKKTQLTYDWRLEKDINQTLEDLALLAERLPEKQLQRTFNVKTLAPLFNALFNLKIEAIDHEDWKRKKEEEEIRERRERLLKLAGNVLNIIGRDNFVRNLLPYPLSQYVQGFPYSRNFEFMIIEAMR